MSAWNLKHHPHHQLPQFRWPRFCWILVLVAPKQPSVGKSLTVLRLPCGSWCLYRQKIDSYQVRSWRHPIPFLWFDKEGYFCQDLGSWREYYGISIFCNPQGRLRYLSKLFPWALGFVEPWSRLELFPKLRTSGFVPTPLTSRVGEERSSLGSQSHTVREAKVYLAYWQANSGPSTKT